MQRDSSICTTPVFSSLEIAEAAHARRQAGRSHCRQAKGKKPPAAWPVSPSQTTLLRNSPGPSPCSCLHAASQLLQPMQRSRSTVIAKRSIFFLSQFHGLINILINFHDTIKALGVNLGLDKLPNK